MDSPHYDIDQDYRVHRLDLPVLERQGLAPEETLQAFGPQGAILTEDHTGSLHSENSPPGLAHVREFVFPLEQAAQACAAAEGRSSLKTLLEP